MGFNKPHMRNKKTNERRFFLNPQRKYACHCGSSLKQWNINKTWLRPSTSNHDDVVKMRTVHHAVIGRSTWDPTVKIQVSLIREKATWWIRRAITRHLWYWYEGKSHEITSMLPFFITRSGIYRYLLIPSWYWEVPWNHQIWCGTWLASLTSKS